MAISSVNFQKTKPNSTAETTREFEAKYLLKKEYRQENSYWNCGKSDREIYNEQRAIYDEAKKGRGKRPSYENCVWEAVVNFNAEHTLEDMKKVAEHIAEKFNIIPTRIAMHRDEGHLNSNGEVVYNYHAHLNFVTLKDAQQNWTVSKTKNKLSDLQTEVAEILGMERGKFKSEAKRLNHKQYRVEAKAREQRTQEQDKLKAELEAVKLSKKEIKEQFEAFRKENAGQGLTKEFFKELSEEKKKQLQEPSYTQDELKAYFTELLEKHTNKKKGLFSEKEVIDYNKIIQEQQKTISDLNTKNDNLKQIANKTIEFIDQKVKIDLNAKFEALKEQNELELTQELRKERQKLQTLADLTLKKKDELEAEQELYHTKYQELSQDEVIKQIEANKNQEINKLKTKNTELEKENETLKQENSKLKLLLKGAEELKEIIKEQLSKELEKAKEQITKLTNTIQRAMQMSFVCSYDRKNKYEMKHIYFKDFTKQSDQEQESTMQSNIKAVKDRELEKQREEQTKKQTKIRTNRGFER